MTVYVRWYGKVLEGELLDGEHLGMKQVRIPLDGHYPIALFSPGHVYNTIEETNANTYPTKAPGDCVVDMINMHRELATKESIGELMQKTLNLQKIENFKTENWDTERNHLRIDKLDEFYQLWRMVMKPDGFVEAETAKPNEAPKRIVSDERMEELKQQLIEKLDKQPQPAHRLDSQKPSKKMLRSTGQQQFNDSTQLALFE